MITIVYNNSNVTLYRIPINNKETKIFELSHRSNPEALQILIDWFNKTTINQTNSSNVIIPNIVSTATTKCYEQNFLLMISGLLVLFFVFLCIFLIYRRRHHQIHQSDQPSICVIDDYDQTPKYDSKLSNSGSGSGSDNENEGENKEMVSNINENKHLF